MVLSWQKNKGEAEDGRGRVSECAWKIGVMRAWKEESERRRRRRRRGGQTTGMWQTDFFIKHTLM